MVGHRMYRSFKDTERHITLSDWPVTVKYVANSLATFGPDLSGASGTTVRCRPDTVNTYLLHITKDVYVLHKFVTLTSNVMFVNGMEFLTNLSRDIRMFSDEHFKSRTSSMIRGRLKKVARLYAQGHFIVRVLLMDRYFEKVKSTFLLIEVNTTAYRNRVPEIEWGIHFIKERARSTIANIPLKFLL